MRFRTDDEGYWKERERCLQSLRRMQRACFFVQCWLFSRFLLHRFHGNNSHHAYLSIHFQAHRFKANLVPATSLSPSQTQESPLGGGLWARQQLYGGSIWRISSSVCQHCGLVLCNVAWIAKVCFFLRTWQLEVLDVSDSFKKTKERSKATNYSPPRNNSSTCHKKGHSTITKLLILFMLLAVTLCDFSLFLSLCLSVPFLPLALS